jgi:hypothetical protein
MTQNGLFQLEKDQKIPLLKAGSHAGPMVAMMSTLLSGSFADLKEFTMISEPAPLGRWHVRLTPTVKNLQDFLSSIEIEGDKHIDRITLHRSNGDRDEIQMIDHQILGEEALEQKALFDD